MTTVNVLNLGFTGAAIIDNQQVLVTNGSITKTQNINYLTSVSIPHAETIFGTDSRTRIKYSDGTYNISGSVSFDVTAPALHLLRVDPPLNSNGTTGLLKRGKSFTVDFFGGNQNLDAYRCTECCVTSLSVSGAVGGVINANLSFVAKNMQQLIPKIIDGEPSYGDFIRTENNIPLGYWYSGQTSGGLMSANIQEWTLDYSQEATPVYLNGWTELEEGSEGGDLIEDDMYPQYIRIGQVTYGLSVTTIGSQYPNNNEGNVSIDIGTQSFIIQATMSSFTYNLAQANGLSTYSHTFEGYADISDGSGGFVIS